MQQVQKLIATALILSLTSITCARNPKTPASMSGSSLCQGLRLGDSSLTPELATGLIQCLNHENKIEPWADLLNHLPQEDFKTLVEFVDRNLVSNTNARNQWIHTYDFLDQNGIKREFFTLLESLFEDPKLLLSIKDLILSLVDEKNLEQDPLIPFFLKDYEKQDFHKTMHLVSELLETPAAISLMSHTRKNLQLQSVAKWYWGYFEKGSQYGKTEAGRLLLQSLRDGSFFKMVHDSLGNEGEEILEMTQKRAILSDISYRDEARFTENALKLILDLNVNPPRCGKSSFGLNNPVLLSFLELASNDEEGALQLVRRDFALQCYFLKNFCDVDADTQAKLEDLFEYLHQPQFPYFHQLILIFKKHGLLQKLSELITNPAMSSHVVPLIGELYDEESFPNWLLLLNLWSPDQENTVERFAERLLKAEADWNGKAAYDLVLERLEKVSFGKWLGVATAFHELNEDSAKEGIRWSQFWQRVSLSTQEHPVEDFMTQVLQAASEDLNFRRAIFRLLSDPAFDEAIRFFSKSAISGTLEQVLDFLVTAFRKTAERESTGGISSIGSGILPASQFRHRYSAEDVRNYQPATVAPPQVDFQVCRHIESREEALKCLELPNSKSVWAPLWKTLVGSAPLDSAKSFIELTSLSPTELNSLWKTWVAYREDDNGNLWLEWVRLGLKQGWIQSVVKWWGELSDTHALERGVFLEALTKNLKQGRCSIPQRELKAINTVTSWNRIESSKIALDQDLELQGASWEALSQDWETVCQSHPEIRKELVRFLESPFFSELSQWAKANPDLVSRVFQSLEKGLAESERLEVINRLERWLD